MIQVVWFKRDLRTADHAPLAAAALAGPVLPLYVVEPDYWRLPDVSVRQWRAQQSALLELAQRLGELGAPLIVREGDVTDILARIHASVGIGRVLAHEETGNAWTFARDRRVREYCRHEKIAFCEFSQTGVIRGLRERDRWAGHFARFVDAPCVAEPVRLTGVPKAKLVAVPAADALGLADDGCLAPQPGSRAAALERLESFLGGRGADYRRGMSSPLSGAESCSRLSVGLSTGAVSVREILRLIRASRRELLELPPGSRPLPVTALDSLVARLHWRSHFMQKLESEPELEFRSLHPLHEATRLATSTDPGRLDAWATGQTGIPFVDACIRSLVATGWLNFRMRAMVQSVAAHHLGLDWRLCGERLARLFTDYEPGIHWPQVQMQSGQTGINVPRIYNPVKQGGDQDPAGVFTRRWVPELDHVPLPLLQTPWLVSERGRAGYPPPIVDIATAARAAKERLTAVRAGAGYRDESQRVFERHGSRRRPARDPRRQPISSPAGTSAGSMQFTLCFDDEPPGSPTTRARVRQS